MAVVTIAALKLKYQTGDFPTEQDFVDLIDTLGVGGTFESKTFALNAAGTDITGSTTGITLEVSGAAAKIRIPTTKTLKLAHITAKDDASTNKASIGKDDGVKADSMTAYTAGATLRVSASLTASIDVNGGGTDGWTGLITTITSTYFEITFTQVGAGLAITGNMHLIE